MRPADIVLGLEAHLGVACGKPSHLNPEPVPHIIIQLFACRILEFRADLAAHLGVELAVGLNPNLDARQFLEYGCWSKYNLPTYFLLALHRWDT